MVVVEDDKPQALVPRRKRKAVAAAKGDPREEAQSMKQRLINTPDGTEAADSSPRKK